MTSDTVENSSINVPHGETVLSPIKSGIWTLTALWGFGVIYWVLQQNHQEQLNSSLKFCFYRPLVTELHLGGQI